MAKPLDDERFKKLQHDAQEALESRPDLFATVQGDLEVAIEELSSFLQKPRTKPADPGDPQKGPEFALAQQQVRVLGMWRSRIVNKRPVEALRDRLRAAEEAQAIHGTSTALNEVRSKAKKDLVALREVLADINDPAKPDIDWMNRTADRSFIEQEIAEIEALFPLDLSSR